MPRTPKENAMAGLDAEVAGADCVSAAAILEASDGYRLTLQLETYWPEYGSKGFELSLVSKDRGDRGRAKPPANALWRKRASRLSTTLKAFAKAFPQVVLPPVRLSVSCRGSGLAPATVERLFVDALAQALGQLLMAAPPAETRPEPESSTGRRCSGPAATA